MKVLKSSSETAFGGGLFSEDGVLFSVAGGTEIVGITTAAIWRGICSYESRCTCLSSKIVEVTYL